MENKYEGDFTEGEIYVKNNGDVYKFINNYNKFPYCNNHAVMDKNLKLYFCSDDYLREKTKDKLLINNNLCNTFINEKVRFLKSTEDFIEFQIYEFTDGKSYRYIGCNNEVNHQKHYILQDGFVKEYNESYLKKHSIIRNEL